jgi:hypothetical protein
MQAVTSNDERADVRNPIGKTHTNGILSDFLEMGQLMSPLNFDSVLLSDFNQASKTKSIHKEHYQSRF